jgi:hypothetical protein
MMIKQIVGKCFIFAGVFMLACVIMGGGQADAGCSDTVCSGNCPGLLDPNCGMGSCTGGLVTCWSCSCQPGFNMGGGRPWCICNL